MSAGCAILFGLWFGSANTFDVQPALDVALARLRANVPERALAIVQEAVTRGATLSDSELTAFVVGVAEFLSSVRDLALVQRSVSVGDYGRVAGVVRRVPSVRDPWPLQHTDERALRARIAIACLVVDARRRDHEVQWALADLHQLFVTLVDAESADVKSGDLQETIVWGRLALLMGLAAREAKRGNLPGAMGRLNRVRPVLELLKGLGEFASSSLVRELEREALELDATCLARSGARARAAGILEGLLRETTEPATQARLQLALAQSLIVTGELDRARVLIAAAALVLGAPLAFLHESERWFWLGESYVTLGNLEVEGARSARTPQARAAQLHEAVRLFEQCIAMRAGPSARLDGLVPRIALCGALVDLGEHERAESMIFPLLTSIDEMRRATVNGRSTVYAFPDLPDLVESGLDLLHLGLPSHPENLARAVTIFDRTRERRVWDAMRSSSRARAVLRPGDWQRVDQLRRERNAALRAELCGREVGLSAAEILAEQLEVFEEGMMRDYPGLSTLTPDYQLADLLAVGARNDVLLFFAGKRSLHVFTLTSRGAFWDRAENAARVTREAQFFSACLASQSAQSLMTSPLGHSLAAALIPRHRELREGAPLCIIASGAIDELPFDALPDADGLVAHHHATWHVPSLTARDELEHARQRAPGVEVVCEMPLVDVAVLERFGIAPLVARARPFLEGAQEITSAELTPERFLELGAMAPRLVHLTTHGVLDPTSGLPVLWLAGKLGALLPEDLETARFERSVIVLQSCRSAQGLDLGGEGDVDFETAFLGAGCLAVVDSHEPTLLRASDQLFTVFYRALGAGHSLAESLRLARVQLIAADANAPANRWAFPRVVGLGGVTVAVTTHRPLAHWLWLAAAAFGLVAVWLNARSRMRGTR